MTRQRLRVTQLARLCNAVGAWERRLARLEAKHGFFLGVVAEVEENTGKSPQVPSLVRKLNAFMTSNDR